MAGAIGYALVQPPAVALVIFFALALGFAAPFSLISSSGTGKMAATPRRLDEYA
jgi:thiol:disulfide interchange protein